MIVRLTTPDLIFTFDEINPSNITAAWLTIKQGSVTIEKDISSMHVGEPAEGEKPFIYWTLLQADTKMLKAGIKADIQLNYMIDDKRYPSDHYFEQVMDNNKEELTGAEAEEDTSTGTDGGSGTSSGGYVPGTGGTDVGEIGGSEPIDPNPDETQPIGDENE
jgi:hypothetical protein